jgi:Armadillo/beta-catenin-like repeat
MSEKRKGQHKQGLLENQTERRRGRAAENRAAKREGALAKRRRSVDTAVTGTDELVEGGEAHSTYEYTEAELAEAVKGVCGSAASALPHLTNLRKILATEDPPVQEVIDAGVVPKLLLLLEHADDRYKTEAVRCIANIASGDKHHTSHVLDGAPLLLSFLSAPSAALQEEALYAIGNIAGDTQECRDMLIAQVFKKKFRHETTICCVCGDVIDHSRRVAVAIACAIVESISACVAQLHDSCKQRRQQPWYQLVLTHCTSTTLSHQSVHLHTRVNTPLCDSPTTLCNRELSLLS